MEKKRAILNTQKNISEEKLLNEIKNTKSLDKLLKNKKIIKSFFIKDKLINILINE